MDLRLKHTHTGLLVGGTGAGKSSFMKRVIENRDQLYDTAFSRIVWHYTEWQPAYGELHKCCGVEFVEGVPRLDDFPRNAAPTLLVIDDCMDQLNNPEILKFFIKGSSHRNLSVWFLSQCLFPKGLRQISLNAHYIVIFKTSRDLAQVRTFCMQINPTDWRALMEAYEDATKEGHSYLLFDFKYNQAEHLRLRTHIFPGENTILYIPQKRYISGLTKEIDLVASHGSNEEH